MPAETLPVKVRRTALQVLSRDRLKEIADRFGVEARDRRSAESYVDALVRSRLLDFGEVLRVNPGVESRRCEASSRTRTSTGSPSSPRASRSRR